MLGVLKWVLTLVVLVLGGLWPVTYWRCVLWQSADMHRFGAIVRGRFMTCTMYGGGYLITEAAFHRGWFVGGLVDADLDRFPAEKVPTWDKTGGYSLVVVPFWLPISLTAVPAGLLWESGRRRRRRSRVGMCVRCGYDRRGLAADAKCPECGTIPTT